jgi:leucyl-tRNA synthetase
MDTFMCSSWYFLRYTSPHHDAAPFDTEKMKYWMPVDLYTGGAEHAVMHLLYARFFSKAIRDMGLVDFDEPFTRLFNQGVIIVERQKMSKSRGNVITPDPYVNELGADTVRAYLMFVAPWEQGGEWDDSGISGIHRWFNRVWNLVLSDYTPDDKVRPEERQNAEKELLRIRHQTIKKVTGDLESIRLNTMIAALMELTNYLARIKETGQVAHSKWDEVIETLLLLLAPTAPHLTEELWQQTGHTYSIHNQDWPRWNEKLTREEEITLVVQVNGKLRDRIPVPASISEAEAKEITLNRERVKAHLEGRELLKTIYVPGRLVNLVVR